MKILMIVLSTMVILSMGIGAALASGESEAAFNDRLNEAGTSLASSEQQEGKQPRNGVYCNGTSEEKHPKGEKLAEQLEVDYETIMDRFCEGYGFGEIKMAYRISQKAGVEVGAVFEQRESGMGWGKIKQTYGLAGKGAKDQTTLEAEETPEATPQSPPGANGKGNPGKGNPKGKGNGNGNGHSKP